MSRETRHREQGAELISVKAKVCDYVSSLFNGLSSVAL